MAAISSRRGHGPDYTWPGYVDALTTLLMVLIFLLSLLSVAQFTLSSALNNRDSAIEQLGRQIATPASCRSRKRQGLQKDLEQLTCSFVGAQRRDRLSGDLAAERRSSDASRSSVTSRAPDLDDDRARQASAVLQSQAKEAGGTSIFRRRSSASPSLGSPLRSPPPTTKGKLFGDLTEEQKLTASRRPRWWLTAELAGPGRARTAVPRPMPPTPRPREQNAQIDLG
jgi:chemotaxis protein MotB